MLSAVRCVLTGLVLLVPVCSIAQPKSSKVAPEQPTPQSQKPPNREDLGDSIAAANRVQALVVLNDLFDLAKSVPDTRTRIKVQAQVADTLWRWDEGRARLLFKKAFAAVDDLKDDPRRYRSQELSALSQKLELREELLRLVTKHDSALAEELAKSFTIESLGKSSDTKSTDATSETQAGNVAAVYLRLAVMLVDSDFPRAVALTEMSLNYGLNQNLVLALLAIRRKDAVIADNLCSRALALVNRDPTPSITFVNYLGPYVFTKFGQGNDPGNMGAGDSLATVNVKLANVFLETCVTTISQQSSQSLAQLPFEQMVVNYMTVRALQPYFDKYLPDQSGRMQAEMARRAERFGADDVHGVDAFTDSNEISRLLEQAEAAQNTDLKDSLYAKAALLASTQDSEKAFAASEKIHDDDLKDGLNIIIGFRAANRAIQKRDIDQAYKYAKGLTSLAHQAYVFAQIANVLFVQKDLGRAIEILNEGRKSVENKSASEADKVRAILILTSSMSRIEPQQGLEFLRYAVKIMNSNSFDLYQSNFSSSEVKFVELVNVNLGLNKFDIDESFSSLGSDYFQEALYLAQMIKNKEASIAAQLAVVRSALRKPQPKASDTVSKKGDKPSASNVTRNESSGETNSQKLLKRSAKSFVTMLGQENFIGATQNFDSVMRRAMPPQKLEEAWNTLRTQAGPFKNLMEVRLSKSGEYDVATAACEFQSTNVNLRIVFNSQSQITGLFFAPITQ